jgi:hypothetical protein
VNDTVELDASLRALWRRKWLVLAGAVLAAAVAAGVSLARPARYETSTLVEVGRVIGEELEDAYAVAETVNSVGFQSAAQARAAETPVAGRISASAVTGGQGRAEHPVLVRVGAWGSSPQAAMIAGQAALDELLARHAELFARAVAPYRAQESFLDGSPDPEARRQLADLRARLDSPIFTGETRAKDPFAVPASPEPRGTAMSALVAFSVSAAILALLVLALAQVRQG